MNGMQAVGGGKGRLLEGGEGFGEVLGLRGKEKGGGRGGKETWGYGHYCLELSY